MLIVTKLVQPSYFKNGKPIDWLAITPKKITIQRVLQEFMVNMKNIAKLVLL
jgi:hypothetical protein